MKLTIVATTYKMPSRKYSCGQKSERPKERGKRPYSPLFSEIFFFFFFFCTTERESQGFFVWNVTRVPDKNHVLSTNGCIGANVHDVGSFRS